MSKNESKAEKIKENPAQGFQFEVVKRVTLPTFKLEVDIPLFCEITDPIFLSEAKAGKDGKKEDRQPAHVANVMNLTNGEFGQIVMGVVLAENIKEKYPDDSYVGKSFSIVKKTKREGKNYHGYEITEIKVKK